ncbi:YtzI protein [Priestia taiwanensis]|uniref:YtzI protein n=1 Tax=Priestia taiwanensis TaxID=1347902 RepID=A0A917AV86_9BACI|nr:YtzI protein [Priestia taiwanensis]MBM7363336.1 hypothetical protein [Priestia taiwanensis]GGE77987.1 hypothetical protein GCM10007140_29560 [Priestia taiwanensis]
MNTVLLVALGIVAVVLILSVLTINKAYSYKHSVDNIEDNPYKEENEKKKQP